MKGGREWKVGKVGMEMCGEKGEKEGIGGGRERKKGAGGQRGWG